MVELIDPRKAASLFGEWPETIIWSCLDRTMGKVYVDEREQPSSAAAVLGDFCFLAGRPERGTVQFPEKAGLGEAFIMVPQNEAWSSLIQDCYGNRAKQVTRYAFKKDKDIFDRAALKRAVSSLPEGFEIARIDEKVYHMCREERWSRDLVSQFADYETYEKLGIGMAVLKEGRPAAGASSYTRYRDGIEIEIDTKKEYRRRGLAYACGAALILECLKRGLYPSWDAQNLWSVGLAKKLGYHFDSEYTAFECEF